MRTVITVHGISTKGQWQEEVRPLFRALQFNYVPYKYSSYRWLGVLKLVLEPWVLFPLGVVVVWARHRGHIEGSVYLFLWLFTVLVLAHLASYVRRWLTLNNFKRQVTPHMLFGGRPHVIAHSFGTYLTAQTLRKFQDARTGHLVLTGCVISRGWDWAGLLRRNQFAFQKIRNEVAMRDRVARLAYFLEGLIPGFGMAGFAGFHEVPAFVHSIDSPNSTCPGCRPPAQPAIIHNVLSPECGHSDVHIGPGYAASFWLPYLWDLDLPEYERFMEMSVLAYEYEGLGDNAKVRILEQELRDTPWCWAGGTLEQYVEDQIRSHPRLNHGLAIASIVSLSIGGVWRAVALASDAARNRGEGWESRVRALHPKTAVAIAVEGALR